MPLPKVMTNEELISLLANALEMTKNDVEKHGFTYGSQANVNKALRPQVEIATRKAPMRIIEGQVRADMPLFLTIMTIICSISAGLGFAVGKSYEGFSVKTRMATTMQHAVDIYDRNKIVQEAQACETQPMTCSSAYPAYGGGMLGVPGLPMMPMFGFGGFGRHRR